MQILQSARQSFLHLGIDPQQAFQTHPFNRKNVLAMFMLSLSTISAGLYFFREAKTFTEYTFSMYAFSSMLVATIIVSMVSIKAQLLFECLDIFESVINESKSVPIIVFKCIKLLIFYLSTQNYHLNMYPSF